MDQRKHLIHQGESIKSALSMLNALGPDAILFVVDNDDTLIGSLTDGDIRRGFIKNLGFEDSLLNFIQPNPVFIRKNEYSLHDLESYRQRNLKIIPIVDEQQHIIDVLNLRLKTTMLPINAVVMAGGMGKRLLPLTANCPKPLLKVGNKPIIEHNIDRLIRYGLNHIHISINYLGHMLEEYFGDGSHKDIRISYAKETVPLGTIGSIKLIQGLDKEHILVMNSDLLTNIDFSDFYASFLKSNADMTVACVGYHVDVPYAVLELNSDETVKSLVEKPRYTYYSNAGIYLMKKGVLDLIPDNKPFDVTDLMETIIAAGRKLTTFPILGYWLDIGKMQDYHKAQEDIKHIQL
ncbi:MAG TPA: nucleotidyltransferase family protein [Chitinophagaceae bacterium]|nr:nucleotidyltransferase family protein [Chitinophagaceae bacterium]